MAHILWSAFLAELEDQLPGIELSRWTSAGNSEWHYGAVLHSHRVWANPLELLYNERNDHLQLAIQDNTIGGGYQGGCPEVLGNYQFSDPNFDPRRVINLIRTTIQNAQLIQCPLPSPNVPSPI